MLLHGGGGGIGGGGGGSGKKRIREANAAVVDSDAVAILDHGRGGVPLPRAFDVRDAWPSVGEMGAPLLQGSCGACYAIAATTILRARLGIHLGTSVPALSAQYLTDCHRGCITYRGDKGCAGACDGGFLESAFEFLTRVGTASEADLGYVGCAGGVCAGGRNGGRGCPGVPPRPYRCDSYYRVNLYDTFGQLNASENTLRMLSAGDLRANEENIMREIHARGPVCALFNIYSDFHDHWSSPRGARAGTVYSLGWQLPSREELGGERNQRLGDVGWTIGSPGPGGIHFREIGRAHV